MPTQILMPALSPTMEEGNLVKWLVAEGDSVRAGDILAEIETDKATMEFESIDDGIVGKILVAEGAEGVKGGEPFGHGISFSKFCTQIKWFSHSIYLRYRLSQDMQN